MVKHFGLALVSGIALLSATAIAGEPKVDVTAKHHPNLNHAQKAIQNAYEALNAAQKANEYDLEGHAAKAKELLQQADTEIKQAAESANQAEAKKNTKEKQAGK